MEASERCSLVIVGAGYAGVCALNAAANYLHPGDRVVVVDKGRQWGGQWVDQYDFVRLHQPYQVFTAGNRAWAIEGTKPSGHLANKKEILAHFQDIMTAVVKERQLDLVTLFGYEFPWNSQAIVDGAVECTVKWVGSEGKSATDKRLTPPASVHIRAERMIKAMGFQIQIKEPLTLPTQRVLSLCPADILQPAWNSYMRAQGRNKPIYFVGSGKTAMDCIYHLSKTDTSSVFKNRLFCLAGRGMQFINRDLMFPMDWYSLNVYGSSLGPDYFLELLEMYDGHNEQECYAHARKIGFFHSPIPDPENFVLGILSVEEKQMISDVLSPVHEKVHKAHLLSVQDDPNDPQFAILKLRRSTGSAKGEVYYHRVPAGTVIVNCTDSLATSEQSDSWEPLVQNEGLVLAPQAAIGFTGPSSNIMVHAWYSGYLKDHWRKLLRLYATAENKSKTGIEVMHLLTVNVFILLQNNCVPFSALQNDRSQLMNIFPLHRRLVMGARMASKMPAIYQGSRSYMKLRWDDVKEKAPGVPLGLAGRLEAIDHATSRL